jgi:hypothetical protein
MKPIFILQVGRMRLQFPINEADESKFPVREQFSVWTSTFMEMEIDQLMCIPGNAIRLIHGKK